MRKQCYSTTCFMAQNVPHSW